MTRNFDSGVVYSRRSRLDLVDIAEYTLRTWGERQVGRYLNSIQDCCARLARYPNMGHACDHIASGLRRIEEAQHVIFYRPQAEGIVVSRILHRSMLPEHHPMQD